MSPRTRLGRAIDVLAGILALLTIVGGFALLWGSQDAMRVLIHWVGEERALGSQNVIRRPDGATLLTNPSAMGQWLLIVWAVGASQVVAGASLLWRATRSLFGLSERP